MSEKTAHVPKQRKKKKNFGRPSECLEKSKTTLKNESGSLEANYEEMRGGTFARYCITLKSVSAYTQHTAPSVIIVSLVLMFLML